MRRTTALCATTLAHSLLALTLLGPAPAGAAAETCRGRQATIVAEGDDEVIGTDGPDVVVVTGGASVDLLGGDDVVCVVGEGPWTTEVPGALIDTGFGDDVVDTTAGRGRPSIVTLGPGADRFEGGAGHDDVAAGDWGGPDWTHQDDHPDVILGGAGPDRVVSGATGRPNADVVDAGKGDDRLEHEGTWAADGSITGGDGADFLLLSMTGPSAVLDNAAGRFVEQGVTAATWTGVERFFVRPSESTHGTARDLTFVGSEDDDSLATYGEIRVTARFGAGDDAFHASGLPRAGSDIDGGDGRDLLGVTDRTAFSLDLRSGMLRLLQDATYAATATAFEDASILGGHVDLYGTGRANRLKVAACTGSVDARGGADTATLPERPSFVVCKNRLVRLRGGAGDDRLIGSGPDDRINGDAGEDTIIGNSGRDRLVGGSGDDKLLGTAGADVLVGGSGRDTANGGPDRDRCRADREKHCER